MFLGAIIVSKHLFLERAHGLWVQIEKASSSF